MAAPDEAVRRCLAAVAVPGTARHYAVRFSPLALRPHAAVLATLWRDLVRTVTPGADSAPAAAALAWWRAELAAWPDGCTHPALTALARLAPPPARTAAAELLAAQALLAEAPQPWSGRVHTAHIAGTGTALARLWTLLVPEAPPEEVTPVAGALHALHLLRRAGLDARRGRWFLPWEPLSERAPDPVALAAGDPAPAPLAAWLAEAEAHLAAPLPRRRVLAPWRALAAVAAATARAELAAGARLLSERNSLTPVRKLWLAWRATRRLR